MKLEQVLQEIDNFDRLDESGIRNIRKLAKQFDKVEMYTHEDLDGITSLLAMKSYLENYGLKVIDVIPINYGSKEYAVPKGRKDTLKCLTDFAHGKTMFQIHQDHHEGQVGVGKGTSTSFKKKPSGAGIISGEISPKEIFPPKDLEIIDAVDSADFASRGLKPEDIMRAAFGVDKSISVKDNHWMMGLVVNKLFLTYKNKKGFIKELGMKSKPSLISLYNNIKKIAKKYGYKPPEQIESDAETYQKDQMSKMKEGGLSIVKNLKNGESTMVGNLIVQYGGGYMGKGRQYDRYTPFKLHPDANYYTIAWPIGLIQLSKNPFKEIESDLHLGEIVMNQVMPKFKSTLENIDVTLETMKQKYESDIKDYDVFKATGFKFEDFIALYDDKIKGLVDKGKFRDMIADITNKPYAKLSDKQKNILKKVTVSAWDVIMKGSGGHRNITNINLGAFIKKNQYSGGYVQLLHDIQYEIAKVMKDK